MNYSKPYLQKYTGRLSRHKCPACHDPHSLARYIDGNTGEYIHKDVGRCNHESGCGYHYTPKQYFIDNPNKDNIAYSHSNVNKYVKQNPEQKEPDYIPFSYVEKSVSYKSSFIHFLCRLFDRFQLDSPTIERLMNDYALGATKDGSIIYWQIDIRGKVRTGKVMRYNSDTGKRIKDVGGINWIHAILKKQKKLSENFNLVQCFFGEHLLKIYPQQTVALVESEKSALIASGVFPEYLWLATGGKSQLSIDKINVLKGRTVIMFPDVDAFEFWQTKAKDLEIIGCNVIVSDLLEKNATDQDRINKIDLADWLIRELSSGITKEIKAELTQTENQLTEMKEQYPTLSLLINEFDLELIKIEDYEHAI